MTKYQRSWQGMYDGLCLDADAASLRGQDDLAQRLYALAAEARTRRDTPPPTTTPAPAHRVIVIDGPTQTTDL